MKLICKYCGKNCTALSAHLKNTHKITNVKEYYDTFIKKTMKVFAQYVVKKLRLED